MNSKEKMLVMVSFTSPLLFMIIVLILGWLTPDYSHFRDTISLLAIKKYGWLQTLNFLQFCGGLAAFSYVVHAKMKGTNSKKVWLRINIFCAIFLIIITLFPTQNLIYNKFLDNDLTFQAKIHFSALLSFFLLAPLGIYEISKVFKNEPLFKNQSAFTAKIGYTLALLCYVWTYFFINGLFNDYKGIFQKIIAVITIYWVIKILYAVKSYKN